MGNLLGKKKKDGKEGGGGGSRSKRMMGNGRSQRKMQAEEELIHRQALTMAIHQQLSQRFDGPSMSRRIGPGGSTSSRRQRNLSDSFTATNQLPEFLESLKTKKIVLIHGEGFGAWCWYKTIALLEESGLLATALDLTGSGIELTDTNKITSLADYSKPLTDFLNNLPEDEKVVLVGHSCGGACVSYALEHFSQKISKAIFLCGTMVSDGQMPFDVFAQELGSAELFMKESKFLIYGNGKDNPPTGFMFAKQQLKGLYFNQSPAKDVALAMVSMRPIPLGPIMEKLSLTPEKYGTGRRFFIQTLDDNALSPDVQEKLVRETLLKESSRSKAVTIALSFRSPSHCTKFCLKLRRFRSLNFC